MQLFFDPFFGFQDPIVGVVGELQFDVLLYRLNDEYKLDVKLERQSFSVARWPVHKESQQSIKELSGGRLYMDKDETPVVLLDKEWDLNWLLKENPDVEFLMTAPR